MYCFSLRWFNQLFVRAILDSPQSSDVPTRLQLLNDYFTFFLYQNVCRYSREWLINHAGSMHCK
jgi:dynein heavy chain